MSVSAPRGAVAQLDDLLGDVGKDPGDEARLERRAGRVRGMGILPVGEGEDSVARAQGFDCGKPPVSERDGRAR